MRTKVVLILALVVGMIQAAIAPTAMALSAEDVVTGGHGLRIPVEAMTGEQMGHPVMASADGPVTAAAAVEVAESDLATSTAVPVQALTLNEGERVEPMAASLTSGCKTWSVRNVHKAFWITKFAWTLEVRACWNSLGRISSWSAYAWPTVYAPTYRFVRSGTAWNSGGVGSTYFEAFRQGVFCHSVPVIGTCLQYFYPWARIKIYAGGRVEASIGG